MSAHGVDDQLNKTEISLREEQGAILMVSVVETPLRDRMRNWSNLWACFISEAE